MIILSAVIKSAWYFLAKATITLSAGSLWLHFKATLSNHKFSSMGIIVCKSENKTIVEYVLRESIDIATYKIVSTLPQELKNQIPEPEQFASLLEGVK